MADRRQEIVLIAAMDRNNAIGIDGALPWHLPDDLKRFKRLTLGHAMLMGRRTAQAIGRALPGRENLVLTRGATSPVPGMTIVRSLDHALALAEGPLMVVGGGEVYALALPRATQLALTFVDTTLPRADAWFPAFERGQWREVARSHHPADARHAFAYDDVDYVRVG
jgi:dihydrofolate reductase